MKIALVHYHLKTGGVTTVLKRQIAALQDSCDLLVLTGDRAGMRLSCPVVEIPGLGYDQPDKLPETPEDTAGQVRCAIRQKWPYGCDLMHIHNPLLAKNRRFLQIIKQLQQAGIRLFLQVHDFAEDGRPQAYFAESYPQDCHYGVINRRDMNILLTAGLRKKGVHYLPNAVAACFGQTARPPQSQVLYPVRAIRRKNLGEAILLSLFFRNGKRLVVTQPPISALDAASYLDWKEYIADNHLPIELGAGAHSDFATLVGDSDSMVTTSVAEGFGMAFLEPWAAGKPLWGRRLPDVCADYVACGLRLDWLYDRLDVPLDWLDHRRLSDCWHTAVSTAAECFGHHLPENQARTAFDRITGKEIVDFGLLNEALQRPVLSRLAASPVARERLTDLNPWLAAPDGGRRARQAVESNRTAVLHHFGPKGYRNRLMQAYERVLRRPVRQRIEKAVVRDAFFRLETFSLLQWGAYEQT